MVAPPIDALALSRRALRVVIALNLLAGAFILALLLASFAAPDWVMRALGITPVPGDSVRAIGARLIMGLGLVAVPVVHYVLTRLRTIVESVRIGDPFVVANSARLTEIAWGVLGLELLHVAIGAVGTSLASAGVPLRIGLELSVTRWLAVLLLFVLARVFEQGALMRADLEGTV
ncbi:MAG: DUF2975 domain-containing protein [Gemmatimonadetes bacterium]|nr:DUF2975 domain-containing protein [Gemmatimonadota bacterium]